MTHRLPLLLAVSILASGLVAASPGAQAQYRGYYHGGGYGYHGGYGNRGGYGYRGGYHRGHGALLGGLAAGVVVGALGAGLLANRAPPPVVYAQPPVVYAAPPPVVYAAPPPPPGYYGY